MPTTWLITGANRGIGLELVRQLSQDGDNLVIATARDPTKATELEKIKAASKAAFHVVPLDVASEASIHAVVPHVESALGAHGLDYLVNNAAATAGDGAAFSTTFADVTRIMTTNVAGPAVLAAVLAPLVAKSHRKVIVNTTSGLASIGLDFGPKASTYTVSKAALNMLTYKQAKERTDLIIFCIDPGWVKTDMGGAGAQLEPHESVTGLLKFFKQATPEHSAGFFRYDGSTVPR